MFLYILYEFYMTTMRILYIAYIQSKLTYGCEIWGGASTTHQQKISVFQNSALRLCLGVPKTTSTVALSRVSTI